MPRCNDCNKFVAVDSETGPSVDLEVDPESGEISGSAEIENNCEECGSILRSASVDLEISADSQARLDAFVAEHEGFTFEAGSEDLERDVKTEGKGRGLRTFYGVTGPVEIIATKEGVEDASCSVEVSGYIQASHMDEA